MTDLFDSARIKLTAFYLVIVMVVSFAFSGIIYRSVSYIFTHRLEMIQNRMRSLNPRQEMDFLDDVREAKNRVLITLVYINGGILLMASVGGYWLAGETLEPIKKTMEEQKRFIADASHELRTPLTALKTSMEVALRSRKLTAKKAKAIIEENLESVNSMEALTSNLLSLASYDQNGQKLEFEELELTEIVKRSIEKIKPLAKKKKIVVELNMEETVVNGDCDGLERMMIVFLDNAVKYTEIKGRLKVSVSRGNKYAEIKFSDNGRGISGEDLPNIFDRFYRVDRARCKNEVCGYGLGLSVAKKIIDLHRGSVAVESELNKGTTFIVKLPLA